MDAGLVEGGADVIFVGRTGEGHGDVSATLEVDAEGQVVPEEQAEDSSDGEDERKAEEVPLFPEPVDIRLTKQFHAFA
jgi:hypothetical protein